MERNLLRFNSLLSFFGAIITIIQNPKEIILVLIPKSKEIAGYNVISAIITTTISNKNIKKIQQPNPKNKNKIKNLK